MFELQSFPGKDFLYCVYTMPNTMGLCSVGPRRADFKKTSPTQQKILLGAVE